MPAGGGSWHRTDMHVRPAVSADLECLCAQRLDLWPDAGLEDRDLASAIVEGRAQKPMPLVLFVAVDDTRLLGFIEVGLRSHADGCDPRRPVGFIEGWYVVPEGRGQGVGRALMDRAEAWARERARSRSARTRGSTTKALSERTWLSATRSSTAVCTSASRSRPSLRSGALQRPARHIRTRTAARATAS